MNQSMTVYVRSILMKQPLSASISQHQRQQSDLWAHQNIFTPTVQLKFPQLHTTIKPVRYATETRVHFYDSELKFLVSRVRSWRCLSTCASISLCVELVHIGAPSVCSEACFAAKPHWCHLPWVASSFEETPKPAHTQASALNRPNRHDNPCPSLSLA